MRCDQNRNEGVDKHRLIGSLRCLATAETGPERGTPRHHSVAHTQVARPARVGDEVKHALSSCLDEGFDVESIASLSMRGEVSSVLKGVVKILQD